MAESHEAFARSYLKETGTLAPYNDAENPLVSHELAASLNQGEVVLAPSISPEQYAADCAKLRGVYSQSASEASHVD